MPHGQPDVDGAENGFVVVGHDQDVMQVDPTTVSLARKEKLTTPYMTKYERARILGTRALQIRFT